MTVTLETAIRQAADETAGQPPIHVELTPWERQKLAWHAAANALAYQQHFAPGMRFSEEELEEMARWKVLANKLALK